MRNNKATHLKLYGIVAFYSHMCMDFYRRELSQPQASLQCTVKWTAICTELGQRFSTQHPFPFSVSFLITDSFASPGGLPLTFTAIQLLVQYPTPYPSPQKHSHAAHILYWGSASDSLSCSLSRMLYTALKLFQLKKISTSNHFGICPTCDVQFFDREFSKHRVRGCWWRGRRCFHRSRWINPHGAPCLTGWLRRAL